MMPNQQNRGSALRRPANVPPTSHPESSKKLRSISSVVAERLALPNCKSIQQDTSVVHHFMNYHKEIEVEQNACLSLGTNLKRVVMHEEDGRPPKKAKNSKGMSSLVDPWSQEKINLQHNKVALQNLAIGWSCPCSMEEYNMNLSEPVPTTPMTVEAEPPEATKATEPSHHLCSSIMEDYNEKQHSLPRLTLTRPFSIHKVDASLADHGVLPASKKFASPSGTSTMCHHDVAKVTLTDQHGPPTDLRSVDDAATEQLSLRKFETPHTLTEENAPNPASDGYSVKTDHHREPVQADHEKHAIKHNENQDPLAIDEEPTAVVPPPALLEPWELELLMGEEVPTRDDPSLLEHHRLYGEVDRFVAEETRSLSEIETHREDTSVPAPNNKSTAQHVHHGNGALANQEGTLELNENEGAVPANHEENMNPNRNEGVASRNLKHNENERIAQPPPHPRPSYSPSEINRIPVTSITDNHVIGGRKAAGSLHPANVEYRRVVAEYKPLYHSYGSQHGKKTKLSKLIVGKLLRNDIQFVKGDGTGPTYLLTLQEIRAKVSQSLRENRDRTKG